VRPTRRLFLCTVLSAVWVCAGSAQSDRVLRFVHVTDTHVMNLTGVHPRMTAAREHYAHTAKAFSRFLGEVQQKFNPAFVLHSGDAIDAASYAGLNGTPVYGQIETFRRIYERSPLPIYLSLGNHDIQHYGLDSSQQKPAADQSEAGRARAWWIRAIDCFRDGTYYSFEKTAGRRRYVFLVLDDGYYGAPGGRDRGYGLAREQLQWLRRQAESHEDDALILALHVPLAENPMSRAIRAALAGRNAPTLAFTGHTHNVDKVEELALGGGRVLYQVRTPAFAQDEAHWRLVRLYEDRIEISPTGKPGETARAISFGLAAVQQ
jgi:3',5'-cyclic AMP phosphodiesterase CpdA